MPFNAIPNVKITMDFGLGGIGWSESHFSNLTSLTQPTIGQRMVDLALARSNCLGGNVVFVQVKASVDNINRDVVYANPNDLPQLQIDPATKVNRGYVKGPVFPGAGTVWNWQSPHLSWPLKMNDQNNNQLAITYLAGMPHAVGQFGPGPYNSTGSQPGKYISPYGDYLTAGDLWGTSSRVFAGGPPIPANGVRATATTYSIGTGAVPAQLGITVTSPVNGVVLAPGVWIRLYGYKFNSPQKRLRLNGSYQIVNYTGTVAIVDCPRITVDPGIVGLGYVQAATYQFQPYKAFTIDAITHRKRGKVPLTPRGRR